MPHLTPPVPGLQDRIKHQLKYLLIDGNAYPECERASLMNHVAAVYSIAHPTTPESVRTKRGVLL